MQHLNTLSQLVSAASSVIELARSSQTYTFYVGTEVTCYVHVAGGEVRIARHNTPMVEIAAQVQVPLGWRVAAEQDAAGVYFVALRRALLGSVANASFLVTVPLEAHLVLKLEGARLALENVNGVLELSPQTANLSIVPK
jgi:hypothetical protein